MTWKDPQRLVSQLEANSNEKYFSFQKLQGLPFWIFDRESSIDSKTFILALMDIAIAAYIGGECKKLASCKLCGEPLHCHAMIHGVAGKKYH